MYEIVFVNFCPHPLDPFGVSNPFLIQLSSPLAVPSGSGPGIILDNLFDKAQIPLGSVPRNFLADLLAASPTSP